MATHHSATARQRGRIREEGGSERREDQRGGRIREEGREGRWVREGGFKQEGVQRVRIREGASESQAAPLKPACEQPPVRVELLPRAVPLAPLAFALVPEDSVRPERLPRNKRTGIRGRCGWYGA